MALFTKAVKYQAKLRMAISGPSGSGKTYTSLVLATELAKLGSGKIAVVDTESGSASKYADLFSFDVAEMSNFHPNNYIKAIREAEAAGYDVVVLDSITHAWTGKGGILDIVGGNFSKWKEVNPIEQAFIQAIVASKIHVIATMRAKTQYEVEKDERGKATPKKVGMGAIQRDGIEYEFDITAMMDIENNLLIEKTRCPAMHGVRVNSPDGHFLRPVIAWLSAGALIYRDENEENERQGVVSIASLDDVEALDLDIEMKEMDHPTPTEDFLSIPSQPQGMNGHAAENGNGKEQADGKLPKPMLRKLHALGSKLYGDNWDTKRYEMVQAATKGKAQSSSDMTEQQVQVIISGMEKRLQAAVAA